MSSGSNMQNQREPDVLAPITDGKTNSTN